MTKTIKVDGVERRVLDTFLYGPGEPICGYRLDRSQEVTRAGDVWLLLHPEPWKRPTVVTVEAA